VDEGRRITLGKFREEICGKKFVKMIPVEGTDS
jgi:hypothetical protein